MNEEEKETIEQENCGIKWNYDIPRPWTNEQSEAWEALIPRKSPEHDPIAWAKAIGIL
jgi:hypothetical protein